MCTYTLFTFLCNSQKLKIAAPCRHISTNAQGLPYCRLDPYAHHADGNQHRVYAAETFGPGVCANEACRAEYGMPLGETAHAVEDDAEYDMSPDACAEREDRWFRECLSTEQQLDAMSMTFPRPFEERSVYAQTWLCEDWSRFDIDSIDVLNPDSVDWSDLNPRYMTARALHKATGILLPASVTDTSGDGKKKMLTTTPCKPVFGPFRPQSHACKPEVGICRTCGILHAQTSTGEKPKYVAKSFAQVCEEATAKGPFPSNCMVHGNNRDRELAMSIREFCMVQEEDKMLEEAFSPCIPVSVDMEDVGIQASADVASNIPAFSTPEYADRRSSDVLVNEEMFDELVAWCANESNFADLRVEDGDQMTTDG